jgi:MoaA/NifB/PqqE/SkfB family radical SAM enzyme
MARFMLGMRNLDIELTNRCNAQCTFCPRDQTPEQGFMTLETFKKCIDRALELEHTPKFHSAGQGEPTLHPLLPDFADYMHGLGLDFGFTTNGSLMTAELSKRILDAKVSHIVFSISDLGEDYEEVYALKFDTTRENILRFLDMNEAAGNPVRTQVSLVAHDLNRSKLKGYRKFWANAGINEFIQYEQSNRGGACDNGNYFVNNSRHTEQAVNVLKEHSLTHVCAVPFVLLFVGWNGQYYLCCNDYRKLTPLGSVFDYSIEQMDIIKKAKFFETEAPAACKNCDLDVINQVREVLFEIEAGEAPASKLGEVTNSLIARQKNLPEFVITREVA